MIDFLEEVITRTRQRLAVDKRQVSTAQLQKRFGDHGGVRPFAKALNHPPQITLIAELKQASPSAGVIRKETDIPGRIRGYTKGGAAALSILTEEHYFHGSPHLLEEARKLTSLPLLQKDFIVDRYQIDESRSLGADALLLIAALLPGKELRDFIRHVRDIELDPLVEVHDERELDAALDAGAELIGINNRNLRTLQVDPATAQRLLPRIPKQGKTVVVESGVREPAELTRWRDWGAHAVLIGETLMRHADPEAAVRSFVEAGKQIAKAKS